MRFGARNQQGKSEEGRRKDVVARAAAAGATNRAASGHEQVSRLKFRSLVSLILLAGTLLVGYSWSSRQYNHPTTLDSWQNAYGVFDCSQDSWLEPFDATANPNGIRSRNDGIIYIEPASDAVAGDNATIEVLLDAVGAQLTDDQLVLPDGTVYRPQNMQCNGEQAVIQIQRWDATGQEVIETSYRDLASTRFLADGQSLVIALAPRGATIPIPPSSADLPPLDTSPVASGFDG